MPHNYPVPQSGYIISDRKGIVNSANNCWMNAALHILCGTVVNPLLLRQEISSNPLVTDLIECAKFLATLYETHQPRNNSLSESMVNLGKSMDMDPTEGIQRDATEFYWRIINCLIEKYQHSDLQETFQSTVISFKACLNCSLLFGQTHHETILSVPVFHTAGSISLKNLLWNKCTDIYTGERQLKLYCPNCIGDAVPGLHESTVFLQNPTILAISTYRAHPETGVINRAPVTTEENLDISDLSINYNEIKSCQYRLFASINHHGMFYNSGHYTATLFDRDRAVTFNDKRIDHREKKKMLKDATFTRNTYTLFYVRELDIDVSVNFSPLPWLLSDIQREVVERGWFEEIKADGFIEIKDLQTACGKCWINGWLISAFISVMSRDSHELKARVFSSYFFTRVVKQTPDNEIAYALSEANLMEYDVMVIPIHEAPNHWSVLGIYPAIKLIVHCDSFNNVNYNVFETALEIINKFCKASGIKFESTKWQLLSPSDIGKQKDGYSCGPYACMYAFSMINLVHCHVIESDLSALRYWIAYTAMHFQGSTHNFPRNKIQFLKEGPFKRVKVLRTLKSKSRKIKDTFSIIKEMMEKKKVAYHALSSKEERDGEDILKDMMQNCQIIDKLQSKHHLLPDERYKEKLKGPSTDTLSTKKQRETPELVNDSSNVENRSKIIKLLSKESPTDGRIEASKSKPEAISSENKSESIPKDTGCYSKTEKSTSIPHTDTNSVVETDVVASCSADHNSIGVTSVKQKRAKRYKIADDDVVTVYSMDEEEDEDEDEDDDTPSSENSCDDILTDLPEILINPYAQHSGEVLSQRNATDFTNSSRPSPGELASKQKASLTRKRKLSWETVELESGSFKVGCPTSQHQSHRTSSSKKFSKTIQTLLGKSFTDLLRNSRKTMTELLCNMEFQVSTRKCHSQRIIALFSIDRMLFKSIAESESESLELICGKEKYESYVDVIHSLFFQSQSHHRFHNKSRQARPNVSLLMDFKPFQLLSKEEFYKFVVVPEAITQALIDHLQISHREVTKELFGSSQYHLEILRKVILTYNEVPSFEIQSDIFKSLEGIR